MKNYDDSFVGDLENENFRYCKRISRELDAYVSGEMYKCPECENVCEYNDDVDDDDEKVITCSYCEKTFLLDDAEQPGMYDYFDDCLDIEYRVGSDKQYKSVCVTITWGGPNVYVDTGSGDVELYWWSERARYPLSKDTCAAIDDYFEELYNC